MFLCKGWGQTERVFDAWSGFTYTRAVWKVYSCKKNVRLNAGRVPTSRMQFDVFHGVLYIAVGCARATPLHATNTRLACSYFKLIFRAVHICVVCHIFLTYCDNNMWNYCPQFFF